MSAPAVLDIFKGDAFSMISMTDAINKIPFAPGRAGALGIFSEKGVATTGIAIEEQSGTLSLIETRLRGEPANQNKHSKRKVRNFNIPHLPLEDTVMAAEVQNVRAFGGNELQGVQQVVNDRLAEMARKHDATVEYGRIGAIKGTILDADGATVIYNLFTEFGIAQDTVDFVLGTAATNIIDKCATVSGYIEDELGAAVYDHVHVFCGKTWWAKFISHDAVKEAYKYFEARSQTVNPLRDDLRYKGFTFGGLTFEQYRGNVGGVGFVADSEAHAFPVGVPGLFRTFYAPADFVETANTVGLPRYARQEMMDFNRGVRLHTQSNPLSMCERPKTLIKLTTSN